jgi:hypothetical protein
MATIHEVLRPSIQGGLSSRQIEQLGIASRSSVSNIKARLQSSGLKAEEALKLSETQLQAKLFAPKASPKSDRPQPDWAETCPTWGDYDNDGWLDIYVTHIYDSSDLNYSTLYHNDGDGTFTETTTSVGANLKLYINYSAAWCDYDQDGDLDLVTYGAPTKDGTREAHLFRQLLHGETGFLAVLPHQSADEFLAQRHRPVQFLQAVFLVGGEMHAIPEMPQGHIEEIRQGLDFRQRGHLFAEFIRLVPFYGDADSLSAHSRALPGYFAGPPEQDAQFLGPQENCFL